MAEYDQKPLPKFYSTSRELRNEAEKQRRNKLNHHVSELAALIPYVSKAQKKVDKTSILRLAASYLRLHNVFDRSEQPHHNFPPNFKDGEILRTLLSSFGGFLLVVSSSGKVVYVSETIEDHFGYSQADILGRSFYSFIHPDDVHLFQSQLEPKESQRRSFYCRLSEKGASRGDRPKYEIIHVLGYFKEFDLGSDSDHLQHNNNSRSLVRRRRRRQSRRTSSSSLKEESGEPSCSSSPTPPYSIPSPGSPDDWDHQRVSLASDTHILVGFVEIVRDRPITELLWVESMRDEYITRHRTDGSIVYVDHRISFVTGLMPEEVVGKSAFEFMHNKDVLWSIVAQKQMFGSSQGQGTVTTRLRCRDGSLVTLRSRGFLEVDKNSGKVDTFVCINTVINDDTGEEETKNQRRDLLPYLNLSSPQSLFDCIASDLPQELKKFVKQLVDSQTLSTMLETIEGDQETATIREIPPLTDQLDFDLPNSHGIDQHSFEYLDPALAGPYEDLSTEGGTYAGASFGMLHSNSPPSFVESPSPSSFPSDADESWSPKRKTSQPEQLVKMMRCYPADNFVSGSLSVMPAPIGSSREGGGDFSLNECGDAGASSSLIDCSYGGHMPKLGSTVDDDANFSEYVLTGSWKNEMDDSLELGSGCRVQPELPWGIYNNSSPSQ